MNAEDKNYMNNIVGAMVDTAIEKHTNETHFPKPTPEPDKKELVGITIGGITSHIDPAQILNMVEIDYERLYEIISDVISNVGAKNINENTIRNLAGTIAVANPITITKEKE